MKHRWYGDPRDLVKWGSVMRIAKEDRLRWIVQIAFLTKDDCIPSVANSSGARPLDGHVLSHFRDIGLVAGLGKKSGIPINVFDEPFLHQKRSAYVARAAAAIREQSGGPGLVLLDPDTGLSTRPKSEHVSPDEVTEFWECLRPRDWLVLYQHADRTRDWRSRRRDEYAKAVPGASVDTFWSPDGAKNVAFFAARKPVA